MPGVAQGGEVGVGDLAEVTSPAAAVRQRLFSWPAAAIRGNGPLPLITRRAVLRERLSMCPDVADHPEVEQYCLRPLASELLSAEIQEELAESLPGDRSLSAG
jgi:hypothetical protein